MFVGLSAGRLGALVTKVPFTKDASGRLLQRALKELNLSRSDELSLQPELVNCYVTNLVKGKCLDPNGNNRLPTVKEFEYWWSPTFIDEMMMVKPRRILALGNPVYQVFRRKLQLEQLHKVVQVKHPRYYASHGALSHRLTKAFLDMTLEYRLAMA